jgi:hypothetical protein
MAYSAPVRRRQYLRADAPRPDRAPQTGVGLVHHHHTRARAKPVATSSSTDSQRRGGGGAITARVAARSWRLGRQPLRAFDRTAKAEHVL